MFGKKCAVVTFIALSSAAVTVQAGDRFAMLDLDGNGTLSKEEASALPGLSERWDQLDVDADGQLTVEEFALFEAGDKEMMDKGKKDRLSNNK